MSADQLERDLARALLGAAWGLTFHRARQDAPSLNRTIRRAAQTKIVVLLIVASPFFAIIILSALGGLVFVFFLVRELPALLIPIGILTGLVVAYHRANGRIRSERNVGVELVRVSASQWPRLVDPDAGYWPGPETAEERCFRLNNERLRREV